MDYTLDSLRQKTDAELAALVEGGLMNDVCYHDDMPTLRYLAEERHLPIDTPNHETLPIIEAASGGSIEMIDFLLAHGADINSLTDEEWYTPLTQAAIAVRPDVVLRLLDLGADPNLGYENYHLVHDMLHYPDVIRRVMECGGNPDVCDDDGVTSFDVCVLLEDVETTPEEDAAIRAKGIRIDEQLTETIQILLEYGASPYRMLCYDKADAYPDTPAGRLLKEIVGKARRAATPAIELYRQIRFYPSLTRDFPATLIRFAEQGADLTAPCPWRGGPDLLETAVSHGSIAAVRYLLEKGCQWKSGSPSDYFQAACSSGRREMVQYLLDTGLTPTRPGLLWNAIYAGTLTPCEMLRLPFEQGWIPEPRSGGFTVLHDLAWRKDSPIALELFVEYAERMGLDPDARSNTGKTPRDIAVERDFRALVSYLDNIKKLMPPQNER